MACPPRSRPEKSLQLILGSVLHLFGLSSKCVLLKNNSPGLAHFLPWGFEGGLLAPGERRALNCQTLKKFLPQFIFLQ